MKITTLQYAKALLELTENKTEKEIGDIVARFADQLKKDGQIKKSKKIIENFSKVYNAEHGIVEAEITTRYKIQNTRYKQMEDFIKNKYNAKKVEIKNTVDGDIKGGIIVRVGDEVLDASVDNQLKRLKKSLIS